MAAPPFLSPRKTRRVTSAITPLICHPERRRRAPQPRDLGFRRCYFFFGQQLSQFRRHLFYRSLLQLHRIALTFDHVVLLLPNRTVIRVIDTAVRPTTFFALQRA